MIVSDMPGICTTCLYKLTMIEGYLESAELYADENHVRFNQKTALEFYEKAVEEFNGYIKHLTEDLQNEKQRENNRS